MEEKVFIHTYTLSDSWYLCKIKHTSEETIWNFSLGYETRRNKNNFTASDLKLSV